MNGWIERMRNHYSIQSEKTWAAHLWVAVHFLILYLRIALISLNIVQPIVNGAVKKPTKAYKKSLKR